MPLVGEPIEGGINISNGVAVGEHCTILIKGWILCKDGKWLVVHNGEAAMWDREPTKNDCLGCGMVYYNCLCGHEED